ncbi:MAG: efflux transporter outer membrane subunit [Nitrosomonadales bacterium]
MTIKTNFLFSGVLMTLAACAAGPDFKTPAAPKAETYTANNEAVPLNQRVLMGKQIQAEWWTLFSSDALNDLIHQAVENNYDLASARETLAQAEEAVKAKSGSLLPQLSIGATAGRQEYGVALFGPSDFNIPPFSYYEVGPSVSWTPDIFGGGQREVERQKAMANYQANETAAFYITLTGDTVSAALEMSSAKAEIEAIDQIIADDKKNLAMVQDSYSIGASSKLDILGAQGQLMDDQSMLPAVEQRSSLSRHALSIYVGNTPSNWIAPNLNFENFTLPQELPLSLPSELVKRRPDILAAEENLHAASAAIGVASANFYPQLTLTANMMQEALTPAGIFSAANNAWSLAAGLTAPIFNGGTLTANKREAEHAFQAALAQYQQTILVAFKQVADALTSLAHDDEEAVILNNALTTATTTLEAMRDSYQAGAIGKLQLHDSERAEITARLAVIRAQHQRFLDCVRLFVALGGSPISSIHHNWIITGHQR